MLHIALKLSCGEPQNDFDAARKNCYLESFVLHFRNLVDFLYEPRNAKPDDILAIDFFPDPNAWKTIRPAKTAEILDAETRVNKLAVHLTYDRQVLPPNWGTSKLYSDLEPALRSFQKNLLYERKDWFPSLRS